MGRQVVVLVVGWAMVMVMVMVMEGCISCGLRRGRGRIVVRGAGQTGMDLGVVMAAVVVAVEASVWRRGETRAEGVMVAARHNRGGAGAMVLVLGWADRVSCRH